MLLPCPLCGTPAHFFRLDDPDSREFGGQGICCDTYCCAQIGLMFACGDDPKPALAEMWNRRPTARDAAPTDECPGPDDIQGWSVTVNVNARDILTIADNCLSGIENIEDFASVVRNCAEHLLSFIGNAQLVADPPATEATAMSDAEIRETVNQLRDIAIQFHNTQQLRERIAHVVVPVLAKAGPAATTYDRATVESWIVRAQISLEEGQLGPARIQLEAALQALYGTETAT